MAPVSQKRIEKKVFERIKYRFVESIISLTDSRGGGAFLRELLAPTEQVVLAKRLSIIFMLLEGASSFRIHKTLAVSTSTVLRFRKMLDGNAFPTIQKYFRERHRREQFWQDMEVLVRLGMPSRTPRRDAWFSKMERKYNAHDA